VDQALAKKRGLLEQVAQAAAKVQLQSSLVNQSMQAAHKYTAQFGESTADAVGKLAAMRSALSSGELPKHIASMRQLQKEMDAVAAKAERIARFGRVGAVAVQLGGQLSAAFSAPSRMLGFLQNGLIQLAGKLGQLAGLARTFSFGGLLGLGTILRTALQGMGQGTVEGDRLAFSFRRLSLAIGDVFAPYVRRATELIHRLTSLFQGLSKETQAQVARWAMIGTAVAGFLAILPAVVASVAALAGALAMLASPFVAIPAAIAGAVTAFGLFSSEGDSMEERITGALTSILNVWAVLKSGVSATVAFLTSILNGLWETIKSMAAGIADHLNISAGSWEDYRSAVESVVTWCSNFLGNLAEITQATFTNMVSIVSWFIGNFKTMLTDGFTNAVQIVQNLGNLFSSFGSAVYDWVTGGFKDWNFDWQAEFGKMNKGLANNLTPFPEMVKAELNKGLPKVIQDGVDAAKDAWNKGMDEMEGNAERAKGIVDGVKNLFRPGAGGGLNVKHEIRFESLTGTWERLQQGMLEKGQQQLQYQQQTAQSTAVLVQQNQQMLTHGIKINGLAPVVGP
jgi:phage-related protein